MGTESEDSGWDTLSLERELVDALANLRVAIDQFHLREMHFAPDLSLVGFMINAWEGATAVVVLVRTGELGHAAAANARVALESGQDALYLATDPEYDRVGAVVRAFERLEHADIRARIGGAFQIPEFGSFESELGAVERVVNSDAAHWQRVNPGMGNLLRNAFRDLSSAFVRAAARKGKYPSHWSGVSRGTMAQRIEERTADEGSAERFRVAYSVMSRFTHPRVRSETWKKAAPGVRSRLVRAEWPLRFILLMAQLGVRLANEASEQPNAKD